jgi:hypothetical protein
MVSPSNLISQGLPSRTLVRNAFTKFAKFAISVLSPFTLPASPAIFSC